MSFWTPWTWLAAYFSVGLLIHMFVPKPPRAKEAFEAAERAHPWGFVLVAALVATFWPVVAIGTLRRLLRGGK